MNLLMNFVRSMRPNQWYKNLVLFVCIVFSLNLFNVEMLLRTVSAFIIFCMLSGGQYIINDILDVGKDRLHPTKSKRPIASGAIKMSYAALFALILVGLALTWARFIGTSFLLISLAYIALSLAYSARLKHLVIVDVLAISLGFVIRAIAGCLAVDLSISPWLIISTFFLALFLALCKRRHEKVLMGDHAKDHRRVLEAYSETFLDQMIGITTASAIVSYTLYTFLAGNVLMMFTIPFVIYGLFRSMFLSYGKEINNTSEIFLKDTGMLINLVVWTILIVLILYDPKEVISWGLMRYIK